MSKRLEFSEDMKSWRTLGAVTDEEYPEKWANLQGWIEEQQPYGFFRAMDDARTVEEIFNEILIKK
jgi:hypothetical protein